MAKEAYRRYEKFTLPEVVRNNCGIQKDNLSFVIFRNDYLLRGHAFHLITPAEFSRGWYHYSIILRDTDVKNLYVRMNEIGCPYVKESYKPKTQCWKCMRRNQAKYKACLKILTEKIIEEYVFCVSEVLRDILEKPRFSKTQQDRDGRRAKMLIGLCDRGIVMKSELMDDNVTYNVVTAYVLDPRKYGNNLSYMIATLRQEIEKRHRNGDPLFCNGDNWQV